MKIIYYITLLLLLTAVALAVSTSNFGNLITYNITNATGNPYISGYNLSGCYGDNELTEEEVEDFVGGMLGGTETLISVDYQDASNDIDFVIASDFDLVPGDGLQCGDTCDDVLVGADGDVTLNIDCSDFAGNGL